MSPRAATGPPARSSAIVIRVSAVDDHRAEGVASRLVTQHAGERSPAGIVRPAPADPADPVDSTVPPPIGSHRVQVSERPVAAEVLAAQIGHQRPAGPPRPTSGAISTPIVTGVSARSASRIRACHMGFATRL